MKKSIGLLVIFLAMLVASSTVQATLISFTGVEGATRIKIFDPQGHFNVNKKLKSHGDLLQLNVRLNDADGIKELAYRIFDHGKLKDRGFLRYFDGSWHQISSLKNGESPPTVKAPEPGTMLLLGIGLIGVSVFARKRFKAN